MEHYFKYKALHSSIHTYQTRSVFLYYSACACAPLCVTHMRKSEGSPGGPHLPFASVHTTRLAGPEAARDCPSCPRSSGITDVHHCVCSGDPTSHLHSCVTSIFTHYTTFLAQHRFLKPNLTLIYKHIPDRHDLCIHVLFIHKFRDLCCFLRK